MSIWGLVRDSSAGRPLIALILGLGLAACPSAPAPGPGGTNTDGGGKADGGANADGGGKADGGATTSDLSAPRDDLATRPDLASPPDLAPVLGTHFSDTATTWPVPAGGSASGIYQAYGAFWSTTDLDGDGRLDLILAGDFNTSKVFGFGASPYWKVYLNTGTGFSATATTWPVTTGGSSNGFNQVSGAYWTILDLNGDKRPDLIEAGDFTMSKVFGFGASPYWKVYLNVP